MHSTTHRGRRGIRNLLIGGTAAVSLALTGCAGSAIGGATDDEELAPGVTDTEIHIGVTFPFSGPLSAYGEQYKGAEAYINYVNEEFGGVESADGKTRKIILETADDQYDPAKSYEQVRKLVENDGVFAIAGVVGTPSNSAIIDYLNENDVPHVFAATGASKWGATPDVYPWSIGFQPAYS